MGLCLSKIFVNLLYYLPPYYADTDSRLDILTEALHFVKDNRDQDKNCIMRIGKKRYYQLENRVPCRPDSILRYRYMAR